MKEFHQRHRLTIQNTFLYSTIKDSSNVHMLLLLSLQFLLSTSVSFPSKDIWSVQGWPLCQSLILCRFVVQHSFCRYTSVNIRQALLWHYTDLGQRLLLSHWTKPGLKVCMLAFRALWFSIKSLDVTLLHKQKVLLHFSSLLQINGRVLCMGPKEIWDGSELR